MAQRNMLYTSPAYGGYMNNEDGGESPGAFGGGRRYRNSPQVGGGYQAAMDRMSAYDAPGGAPQMSGGMQSAPQMTTPQQAYDQTLTLMNRGAIPRGPSFSHQPQGYMNPAQQVGYVASMGSNPFAGAVAARQPGNERFADILGAGMSPVLSSNRLMGTQADIYGQYGPQMAQQNVRGATLGNDVTQAGLPYVGPQAEANVGLTGAQAGHLTATGEAAKMAGGQVSSDAARYQREAQAHARRADIAEAKIADLTAQLSKFTEQQNKPGPATRPMALSDGELKAAWGEQEMGTPGQKGYMPANPGIGFEGVQALRKDQYGDPTTRPDYKPPQPAPTSQPAAANGNQQSQRPTVTNKQEYDALPSGAPFIWNGQSLNKK